MQKIQKVKIPRELRFAAVALLAIGLALPACAQRGGGGGFHGGGGGFHGGFSARSGPAGGFRGGFSAPRSSAPRSFNGFSSSRPNKSFARMPRYARPFGYARPNGYRSPYSAWRNPRYGQSFRRPGFRQWRGDGDRFRNRFRDRDRFRERAFFPFAPSIFFIPDWIGLGTVGCYPDGSVDYYDSFDDFDCNNMQLDDQDQDQDQPQVYGDDNGYGSEIPPPPPDQPQYQQPQYQPPAYHNPAPSPSQSQMPSTEIAANQTTTIIFNNGHAPEQIHDYALTGTTLYVLGQHQQEIPLSEIDLARTEQTNRNAGIEFQVPEYQITQ